MTRARVVRIPAVAWALVFGGLVYFASAVRLADHAAGRTALTLVALAVLLQLVRTVDPAWLLSAGIVSTIFAGHWELLHVNASLGLHRVLLIAALLAVLLR